MGRKLAGHNYKILKNVLNPAPNPQAVCNCQKSKRAECPMPGACNQDGEVYEATVSTTDGRVESYVDLARNFKKRWPKHKTTLGDRNADGQTTLSTYVWKKRDEGLSPIEKKHSRFQPYHRNRPVMYQRKVPDSA